MYVCVYVFLIFVKILFVRERVHKQGELEAEGEVGSPPSKERDVGLDPRTQMLNQLSHPGAPT